MTADIIQARYDQLDNIANRFGREAENTTALMQQVQRGVDALRQGGWEGQGGAAFLGEMETAVFLVIQRLTEALSEANTATQTLRDIIRTAEEEAASLFQGRSDAGNANSGWLPGGAGEAYGFGGAGMGGAAPAAGQAIPLADRPSSELVVKPPSEVFREDYMESMIGSHFQGENNPEMNNLMEQALGQMQTNGKVDSALLDRMADLRGVDREAFRQQYEKFENLWRNAKTKGDIDLTRHGDFMGSTVSMRYGKVVGDVFGIDPVFGSLLNPTGGLVGPDSSSYWPGDNDAVGYHGVFHDAAGYMYNIQGGIGPGYDYLGESSIATTNPLSGQVDGISWWASHAGLDIDIPAHNLPDIPYVPDFLEPAVGHIAEGLLKVVRPATYVVEGGGDIIDGIGDVFDGNFAAGFSEISQGVTTIFDGAERTADDLAGLGKAGIETVTDWSSKIFGWP